MRAVVCRASCRDHRDLVLEELPPPVLPEGCVRIAVHAAGVNFADSLILQGRYQEKIEPPFVPGFEVAGVVTEIKATAAPCRVGDRVMAMTRSGGFAEECVAQASDVFRLPDAMNFIQAAGFPIAYGTSHYGLKVRAQLQHEEVLVVHGAAGGVGLTAVECGNLMGATVIATSSTAEKLAIAAERGAHHLVDYRYGNVREQVRALTGGHGANVIYDPVGGEITNSSLRALAPNGRLLVVGFASGQVPQIPANILMVKNVSCMGFSFNAYRILDPAGVRTSFAELLAWFVAGLLRPHICCTLDLAEASRAIETLLERSAIGKVILTTGGHI
ncbi:Quinone oxidoreductase [invertebrate metagenome]|uniref:Quinone oxidoreductase n=1 Tax=invertebrate metagenome TaxID=1711999 RepID=A0A484H7Y2_9ZZZZ